MNKLKFKKYFLILLTLTIQFFVLFAQDQFPETPAGKRAKEIFEVINAGNVDKIKNYIQENLDAQFKNAFPMSQHVNIFQMTKNQYKTLNLDSINSSAKNSISVLLYSDSAKSWLKLEVNVTDSDPYKITRIAMMPIMHKTQGNHVNPIKDDNMKRIPQFSNEKELALYLEQVVDDFKKKNDFSGVVLIAKNGKPIFEKAYGLASKNYGVKNTVNTKFNIGSLTKHLTSIAVLQLAQKGLLKIDDTIGNYLKIFPDNIANKVTIRHLLTMTSGWGDYWDNDHYLKHRYELRTVSDYMNFIKDIPLDFEPGTSMQHSNIGFEVAGAIIEKVSGTNYYDYIRDNIYKPAGMENSGSCDIDGNVNNLATGYTNDHPLDIIKEGYKWSNTYLRLPVKGTPTGGSYSTVGDLLKLDQAQRNFKLLDSEHTIFLLNGLQGNLGDPFMMNKGILHYFGGAEGVGAVLGVDMTHNELSSGYTIIILSNYDFPIVTKLYEEIKEIIYSQLSEIKK